MSSSFWIRGLAQGSEKSGEASPQSEATLLRWNRAFGGFIYRTISPIAGIQGGYAWGVAEPIFVRGREKTFRGESLKLAQRPANRVVWEPDFGAAIREMRTVRGNGG